MSADLEENMRRCTALLLLLAVSLYFLSAEGKFIFLFLMFVCYFGAFNVKGMHVKEEMYYCFDSWVYLTQ